MKVEVKEDDEGCSILIINGEEIKLDLHETRELAQKLTNCEYAWIRKAIRGE
jgi:hypothetical protein